MHQWAAYLDPSLGLGSPGHWGTINNIESMFNGCKWADNGDGTFRILGNAAYKFGQIGALELYLMGLIPREFRLDDMNNWAGPKYLISGEFRLCSGKAGGAAWENKPLCRTDNYTPRFWESRHPGSWIELN
jgi:hypothetical protein